MKITNTLNKDKVISDIYYPEDIDSLKEVYISLKDKQEKIYVYSKGNNWGYGCNSPHHDNTSLISLEKMNSIIEFDKVHGLVTLEPGVTYGQLANFLIKNGDEWIAPVHGGGPDCSVLGNAIERGYGLTPRADHFDAVTHLEALLEDGSFYKGNLTSIGQERLDKLFKYGIGPYYDGLFTQSGVGIVTNITIRLAKKPEYIEMFSFRFDNEHDFERVIEATKKSCLLLGDFLGGINIINGQRMLSMMIDYPLKNIENRTPLSSDFLEKERRRNHFGKWNVVGAMYGSKPIVKGAKKVLEECFKGISKSSIYFNSGNRNIYKFISHLIPKFFGIDVKKSFEALDNFYDILNGRPNYLALKLAYLKNTDKTLVDKEELNPRMDNCGLIWYSPLIEMDPSKSRKYVSMIDEISAKYGFDSFITMTTINDLCFDSTVPILFNKDCELDTKRAHNYYNELLREGARRGFFPYRLSVESQKDYKISNDTITPKAIIKDRYK